MLDPNRHEWKTLNEYVQTISKGYMNHLYEKYQNIRNETEVSEKTKATATTKLSRKQREQQQQQQQQQSGNMIETLFESEPRVYPSDYSTFSESLSNPFRLSNQPQRSRFNNNKFAVLKHNVTIPNLNVFLVNKIVRL